MMGLSFTEQAPFRYVYLHGLVRDGHGRKMSKTYGNVIDPLEVMDEYGTDALRFTLLTGSTPGNDMNLAIERVTANRNFANKIWNAARVVVSNLYGDAGRQNYDFLWGEYADSYIEISKIALHAGDEGVKTRTLHILTYVLDQCLRMLHPFVPFVTEEIWQHLPHEGPALIVARWPEADAAYFDEQADSQMTLLMELIRGIRNIRAEYNVQPSRRIPALIAGGEWAAILADQRELFTRLANLDSEALDIRPALEGIPDQAASVTVGGVTAFLPLAGLVDLDA